MGRLENRLRFPKRLDSFCGCLSLVYLCREKADLHGCPSDAGLSLLELMIWKFSVLICCTSGYGMTLLYFSQRMSSKCPWHGKEAACEGLQSTYPNRNDSLGWHHSGNHQIQVGNIEHTKDGSGGVCS